MASRNVIMPEGWVDAKVPLLVIAIVGEVVQGGLFFGWNALSLMLSELGNYNEGCPADTSILCSSQESKLAAFWTIGIFSLNCGPVLMGVVLDYLGPKVTAMVGTLLNILGLILFAVGQSSGPKTFAPAAIFLGLGNVTFHIAQFHASALFPRVRGMVASGLVAGFTGSGIVMYLLLLIFQGAGSTRGAFMGVMLGYAGLCALWFPLMAWVMPNSPFRVGEIYLFNKRTWRFQTRLRAELAVLYRRPTSLQDFVAANNRGGDAELVPQRHDYAGVLRTTTDGGDGFDPAGAHTSSALVPAHVPDSSAAFWLDDDEGGVDGTGVMAAAQPAAAAPNGKHANGAGAVANGSSGGANGAHPVPVVASPPGIAPLASSPPPGASPPLISQDEEAPAPLPPDVAWGPLVFEARRFVELRKQNFVTQLTSPGSIGMCIFYTLNVFTLQFYLGTMRLQLADKGPGSNAYSNFGNVVVAFAFLSIPLIAWLLDKKGYGYTLATINCMGIATLCMQAIPSLALQALTIVVWMLCRFFMYASYFAIFGSMFGPRNFGRLVAVDNLCNGVFSLLQYPLTYWGLHQLEGNFMVLNLAQAAMLLPMFAFCWAMYRWEREDLVPMRPLEGEELPCDQVGQRQRKRIKDIHLPRLDLHMPNVRLPDLRGLVPRRASAGAEHERDVTLQHGN